MPELLVPCFDEARDLSLRTHMLGVGGAAFLRPVELLTCTIVSYSCMLVPAVLVMVHRDHGSKLYSSLQNMPERPAWAGHATFCC